MLPKIHLTSHSRMSDCRCVATPSWVSRLLRILFFYRSVYSCHLLISSISVSSLLFLFFFVCSLLHKMFPWYLQFFEVISSVSHFIGFLYFFHCSLKKAFLSFLAILCNSAFSWVYFPLSLLLFLLSSFLRYL